MRQKCRNAEGAPVSWGPYLGFFRELHDVWNQLIEALPVHCQLDGNK